MVLFNYDVSEKVSRRVSAAVFQISLLSVLGAKYDNLGVAIDIERKITRDFYRQRSNRSERPEAPLNCQIVPHGGNQ